MSKRFKHTESEAAKNWDTDTRTDERIACLVLINEHKLIAPNVLSYEYRNWSELPNRVKQKLRRVYDDSTPTEVEQNDC